MSTKVLADLVAEVLSSGKPQRLDQEQLTKFQRDFESSVFKVAEEMRVEKRRAYEVVKTIAVM